MVIFGCGFDLCFFFIFGCVIEFLVFGVFFIIVLGIGCLLGVGDWV